MISESVEVKEACMHPILCEAEVKGLSGSQPDVQSWATVSHIKSHQFDSLSTWALTLSVLCLLVWWGQWTERLVQMGSALYFVTLSSSLVGTLD